MKPIISLFSILFVCTHSAYADLPPAPSYVENCTIDKQQTKGEQCISCGDAFHGDVDACKNQYTTQGYTKKCQTSGASVWTEIWCKTATQSKAETVVKAQTEEIKTVEKPMSPKTESSSCAYVSNKTPFAAGLLILGFVIGRRRQLR